MWLALKLRGEVRAGEPDIFLVAPAPDFFFKRLMLLLFSPSGSGCGSIFFFEWLRLQEVQVQYFIGVISDLFKYGKVMRHLSFFLKIVIYDDLCYLFKVHTVIDISTNSMFLNINLCTFLFQDHFQFLRNYSVGLQVCVKRS